ncbi:MAG TPA: iron-sulfur cluster insertion protein ErpA, partial [Acidimicrobiales bacterium]|nr:iron-sulfur cluster insertion protein ErpA [Acidimicrobiales bacterium]
VDDAPQGGSDRTVIELRRKAHAIMVRAIVRRPDMRGASQTATSLYDRAQAARTGGVVSTTSATSPTGALTLTDGATAKVKELLDQEGNAELFLRVAVRPGGCSGYSYEMFFDSERVDDDLESEAGGVKVLVDPASAALLMGATLDYKDGLQGAGFSINNPNATRTCGCGQSFS